MSLLSNTQKTNLQKETLTKATVGGKSHPDSISVGTSKTRTHNSLSLTKEPVDSSRKEHTNSKPFNRNSSRGPTQSSMVNGIVGRREEDVSRQEQVPSLQTNIDGTKRINTEPNGPLV